MSTFVALIITGVVLTAGAMAIVKFIGILDAINPQDDDL